MSNETVRPTGYEFGPKGGVPLKDAIAQTEGVTIVRTSPARGANTSLKLMEHTRNKGIAILPSEVLFVSFDNPVYCDIPVMNNVISNIANRIRTDNNSVSIVTAGTDERESRIHIGSIEFTEKFPQGILAVKSTMYQGKSPFVNELLESSGIVPKRSQDEEQAFDLERTTYAVFYPSRLFAATADNFGQETELGFKLQSLGIFGARTVFTKEEYRMIASAGKNELEALCRVFLGHRSS